MLLYTPHSSDAYLHFTTFIVGVCCESEKPLLLSTVANLISQMLEDKRQVLVLSQFSKNLLMPNDPTCSQLAIGSKMLTSGAEDKNSYELKHSALNSLETDDKGMR